MQGNPREWEMSLELRSFESRTMALSLLPDFSKNQPGGQAQPNKCSFIYTKGEHQLKTESPQRGRQWVACLLAPLFSPPKALVRLNLFHSASLGALYSKQTSNRQFRKPEPLAPPPPYAVVAHLHNAASSSCIKQHWSRGLLVKLTALMAWT